MISREDEKFPRRGRVSGLRRDHPRFAKTASISEEAESAKSSNVPAVAMLRAARTKAPQATRAKAEPTEMRRTPRSASWETVSVRFALKANTFTGFGETA